MLLNHPPLSSVEKVSSMKLVPGAKNTGDCGSKGYLASRWIMKNKQRLSEKLSQTKGIYGDMKTKCNVALWTASWNRKRVLVKKKLVTSK